MKKKLVILAGFTLVTVGILLVVFYRKDTLSPSMLPTHDQKSGLRVQETNPPKSTTSYFVEPNTPLEKGGHVSFTSKIVNALLDQEAFPVPPVTYTLITPSGQSYTSDLSSLKSMVTTESDCGFQPGRKPCEFVWNYEGYIHFPRFPLYSEVGMYKLKSNAPNVEGLTFNVHEKIPVEESFSTQTRTSDEHTKYALSDFRRKADDYFYSSVSGRSYIELCTSDLYLKLRQTLDTPQRLECRGLDENYILYSSLTNEQGYYCIDASLHHGVVQKIPTGTNCVESNPTSGFQIEPS